MAIGWSRSWKRRGNEEEEYGKGKRRRDKDEAETRVPGYRTQRLVPSAGKLSLPHLPFGLGRPREGAWMAPARCHLLARGLA